MYRSYIYICIYTICCSVEVIHRSCIKQWDTFKTVQRRIKSLQKLLHHISEKKANWNHVSTILKNYCLTILSVKIYATLKAFRQSWTMAMEEETQTPWKKYWFLIYLFTFGFKINPISVDLFPNKSPVKSHDVLWWSHDYPYLTIPQHNKTMLKPHQVARFHNKSHILVLTYKTTWKRY